MEKTTVYLPADLKARLSKVAERSGVSEAHLIRKGVERIVEAGQAVRPRLGLFKSGEPTLAERADAELRKGFGRR